ncbi:MAG: GMC family oxidoreductase N-terminal domain-containing protein [Bacteroidota bacterium]
MTKEDKKASNSYDYIIVGAGSAGCVLANRLSANPLHRVLLLEAGGNDRIAKVQIPAALSKNFKSDTDWDYETIPQSHLDQRPMYQPRGKVLGGCSSINAMIYIRGHRYDYDQWAQLGNPGWDYDSILPYFKKSEDNARLNGNYHGKKGPLRIEDGRSINDLSHAFIQATQNLGLSRNPDFNGAQQEGFGYYQLNQKKGSRWNAAEAFLHPIKDRPNLEIATQAEAQQILLKGKKAIGIRYHQQGTQAQTAYANREVVLAAGAFNSPLLLLRSGIGPAEELQAMGREVRHLLPGVGKNLQDHLLCGIAYEATHRNTVDSAEQFPRSLLTLWKYVTQKKGHLTSNVAEAGGFVKSSPEEPAPDLQFHFAPAFFIRHGFENPRGINGYSLGVTLVAPESVGEIRLNPTDPTGKPIIDPRYYSNHRDLEKMTDGCLLAQRILQNDAFAKHRKRIAFPDKEIEDRETIQEYLRYWSETLYHPIGTCKMGTDAQAVVDPQLRVHGVQQLRVIDASIMPTIPRGNTNAPTIMIAEKGADLILNQQ